jgi:acetyl-CoA carboxylase carboxyl transferase subunit alpha
MHHYLDFEKPISDLDGKILELKKIALENESIDTADEISRLEGRAKEAIADIYAKLNPWQKTQVARHPQRPHFLDYAAQLFDDFTPLAGDRRFGEDAAIQTGLARFKGRPVALIGQEKGSDTKSRIEHNFGSARPEGYRKAIRIMEMAAVFR